MDKNIKLSVVIPVYAMENGEVFLRTALKSLRKQTFGNFEVVIPDNCPDLRFEKVIKEFPDLDIHFFFNDQKGMAQNTNAGIKAAKGKLIKILYQDDALANESVLQNIVAAFDSNFDVRWLITGCDTNKDPYYTDDIQNGNNKLGSPSVLTIRNEDPLLFDEKLGWLLDCDYYKRMQDKFGEPLVLLGVFVKMGIGPHQQTNILPDKLKASEHVYMQNKYK